MPSTSRHTVLLCSIDGMRPDALKMADTPFIDSLAAGGAATWTARTVMPSCTLPCHTSMLRGVDSTFHGITDNTFHQLVRPIPSLIDVAHDQGKKTGFFYNWEQLRDLAAPGKLSISSMYGDAFSALGDTRVADAAIAALDLLELDFIFVYFGWTDECAHIHGWMSEPYLEAIGHADVCLKRVVDAVTNHVSDGNLTVLVTSDHGGHDRTHGTDRDEDMLVPWILNGPGVKRGWEIKGPVRIFDTCVTLAAVMGLPSSSYWEGSIISEAFIDGTPG